MLGESGTSTSDWNRSADAHSGSYSEKLVITAYTSGDLEASSAAADAARLTNVSRNTIYSEVERGSLRALHVGGRLLRIDPTDFCRWLGGGTE